MGANIDWSKGTARSTKSNKEPVTLDQLADVEENILRQLDVLYEKLSAKGADDNKKNEEN